MITILTLFTTLALLIATGAAVTAARVTRQSDTTEIAARLSVGSTYEEIRRLRRFLLAEQERVDSVVRVLSMMADADYQHMRDLSDAMKAMHAVDRTLMAQQQATDLDIRHLHAVQRAGERAE